MHSPVIDPLLNPSRAGQSRLAVGEVSASQTSEDSDVRSRLET